MFGVERIRSFASAGAATALTGALAFIGVVWISIAAVTALAEYLVAPVAQMIVGLALMLPLLVVLLRQRKPKPAPQPAAGPEDLQMASMMRISALMEEVGDRSPVLSAGVALVAGVIAARMPSILPLFVQVLQQALTRRARQPTPPVEPQPTQQPHPDW